ARYGLDPHGLPDPRRGRVPDAFGLSHLLAARLVAGVSGVEDANDQFLIAVAFDGIGAITGERVVSAAMFPHFLSVERNHGLPVVSAVVKYDALIGIGFRQYDRPVLPETLDMFLDGGELGLDRERNQYGAIELLSDRRGIAVVGFGPLPRTVQV